MSTETPLNLSLPSNKFGFDKIQTKYTTSLKTHLITHETPYRLQE